MLNKYYLIISQLKLLRIRRKKKKPMTYFSIPTKVYVVPDFVSTSKSKDLFVPALRAKFTVTTSSKRM